MIRDGDRAGVSQASRLNDESLERNPVAGLTFVVAMIVLSAALPLQLIASVPDSGRSEAWKLTAAVMVWSGARLSWQIADGRPRLFEFVWWLFTYVFMGLAPTVQLRANDLPGTTPNIPASLDEASAWLVIIGIAAFEVGRFIWRLRRSPTPGPKSINPVALHRGRTYALGILGLVLIVYMINAVGLGSLFSSRTASGAARAEVFTSGSLLAVINSGAIFGTLVAIHSLNWLRREDAANHRKSRGLGFLLLLVVALLVFKNPISSARYTFGVIAFSLAVMIGMLATARLARLTKASTVAVLFFVFPIADAFRRTTTSFGRDGFFAEYATPDYDAFAQISNTVAFVSSEGATNGRQLAGVLFFWVPRSVWPDKAVDTGTLLAEHRGYNFTNLSAPLWAEMYINGGVIALLVAMVAAGFLFGAMDGQLHRAFKRGGAWAIVGAILPIYMLLVLRGSLLQATSNLVLVVTLIIFLHVRKQAPVAREVRRGRNILVENKSEDDE